MTHALDTNENSRQSQNKEEKLTNPARFDQWFSELSAAKASINPCFGVNAG
jgi:hypothetical protein